MAAASLGLQLVLVLMLYSQITADANAYPPDFVPAPSPVEYLVLPLLYVTGCLLAFALGVVTLTSAAQQRRRRWFIPLLPLIVLVGYGTVFSSLLSEIIFIYSRPLYLHGVVSPDSPPSAVYAPLLVLVLPIAVALTALAYAGKGTGTASIPESGAPSGAEEPDDELEISPLDAGR